MLSDVVITGKVFTALKDTLALVVMLAMGLQKKRLLGCCFVGFFFSDNLGRGTRYRYPKNYLAKAHNRSPMFISHPEDLRHTGIKSDQPQHVNTLNPRMLLKY